MFLLFFNKKNYFVFEIVLFNCVYFNIAFILALIDLKGIFFIMFASYSNKYWLYPLLFRKPYFSVSSVFFLSDLMNLQVTYHF